VGKASPPPPPDYEAAARQTAAGNIEMARQATLANRVNQFTPYGNLTWTQNPTETVDYAAYNKALEDYNAALAQFNASPQTASGGSAFNDFNAPEGAFGQTSQTAARGPAPIAPTLDAFRRVNPDSGWSQQVNLSPEAQAALDQQLALNQKYGEVANIGFDRARSVFENPQLDMSVVPERAINVGQTAQEAILSRLNPQLAQQEDALRTRLANQGITLGSEAYGREMSLNSQRWNDLQMQAALQGINLDQANRASALQEQAFLQDRPLNLINALRTGNQVQAPQFAGFAQQATTAGPDILGATNAQYQAQVDATNAQNASTSGMLGGLLGVGLGLAELPGAGGSILQGARGLFR
jgi:hypothetical protein